MNLNYQQSVSLAMNLKQMNPLDTLLVLPAEFVGNYGGEVISEEGAPVLRLELSPSAARVVGDSSLK